MAVSDPGSAAATGVAAPAVASAATAEDALAARRPPSRPPGRPTAPASRDVAGVRRLAARRGPFVRLSVLLGLAGVTLVATQAAAPLAPLAVPAAAVAVLGIGLALAVRRVRCARHACDELTRTLADWRARAAGLAEERTFLARILDELPEAVAVLDERGRYRFANVAAALRAGRDPAALLGQPAQVVGDPQRAAQLRRLSDAALESGEPQDSVAAPQRGETRAVATRYLPLVASGAQPSAVLLLERDVTADASEGEDHRDLLEAAVETILGVVDQRDPYAAYHGWRLGLLAEVIARELGAADSVRETARRAGHLLAAGKSLVPEAMLSQDLELGPSERAQVQASLAATIEIVEPLDFDGPISRTLGQLQERVDGQGFPLGLPEERILLSARILKVANAFLGLIGRQPGAAGLDLEAALDELWRQAGFAYDARVVEALSRHLGSGAARDAWDPTPASGNRRRPAR